MYQALVSIFMLFNMCGTAMKFTKTSEISRYNICMDIGNKALIHHLDPSLPIALAISESGFVYTSRSNGPEGPLQVVKKFSPCSKCDAVTSGIVMLKELIETYGEYEGLCIYAAGIKGRGCKRNRYVNMVLLRRQILGATRDFRSLPKN